MSPATVLIFCGLCCGFQGEPAGERGSSAKPQFDEALLLDRLHQTFVLLNQRAIPAYLAHFQGDPANQEIVQYYAKRLDAVMRGDDLADLSNGAPGEAPSNSAPAEMFRALSSLRPGQWTDAASHLKALGTQPHAELRRSDVTDRAATVASCPLYDPAFFRAHQRLREFQTGTPAAAGPANPAEALVESLRVIRSLRDRSGDRELSLRKFLDKHRPLIAKLAWLYRCRGMELDADPVAARACYLRAWTVDDSLFPVSERGRLDRFDPVFLAELGDIYARLERYDLMIRYIYYDDGLPRIFSLAAPVAEMARVAESARLVHLDESGDVSADNQLPETISQILFELPVTGRPELTANSRAGVAWLGSVDVGWSFVAVGGGLICLGGIWWLSRFVRRTRVGTEPDFKG